MENSQLEHLSSLLLNITNSFNGFLWSKVLVYLLVAVGLYFTVTLGFIQVRRMGHAIKILRAGRKLPHGLSSYKVFCVSLAARVGTGNMAGVAVALTMGGPGSIFWMWLSAFFGMATAMIESVLAQVYKIKDSDGQFRGGPAYYMTTGIGKRWMGTLFSIFLILTFGLTFEAVQSNTMTEAIHNTFGFNKLLIGGGIVFFTAIIIMGGLEKVANVAVILVPIMAIFYLLLAGFVVIIHMAEVPAALSHIIKNAFGWQEAGAGVFGYGIAQAMRNGIARGLHSNEAGMGSAANIAASATPVPNHPASQGYVQMFGVFVDTFLICTASAAIIILTHAMDAPNELTGIALLQQGLLSEFGSGGNYFVIAALLLFAFTTIIANYAYAETNFMFLNGNKKKGLLGFRLLVLAMVLFGSVASLPLVWSLADTSMGLMVLTNIIALLILSKTAFKVIKDYETQVKAGKVPTFDCSSYTDSNPDFWK